MQGARVYKATPQTLITGTLTPITFDLEHYDSDNIHDNVTDNTRLTCKTAGTYLIGGCIAFAANATGARIVMVSFNGTGVYLVDGRMSASPAGVESGVNVNCVYPLAINNYVELIAYQSSGGNLNVQSHQYYSPEFWMQRIG
jgi:hypothetical protein